MRINKDYKIMSVKTGVSSKGNNYTILSVKDNKKNPQSPTGWDTMFYKLFIGSKVDAFEGNMINIKCIKELDYTEKQVGDKVYRDCTLFLSPEDFTITGGIPVNGNTPTPFDDDNLQPASNDFKAPWD